MLKRLLVPAVAFLALSLPRVAAGQKAERDACELAVRGHAKLQDGAIFPALETELGRQCQ